MSRFPNVIGVIYCTHIAIRAPSDNEFAYVNRKNRKHFHLINVQVISDAQMSLTNVALWPGSTHDSFTLWNSSVGNFKLGLCRMPGFLVGYVI